MQHPKPQSAFTLVELSIVLVIIGLLTGSILVGSTLIHSAELQALYSEKEKFLGAVSTFTLKYDCLPGDCVNAKEFNLENAPNVAPFNGDGNGLIGDPTGATTTSNNHVDEISYFWIQLAGANLIPTFDWPCPTSFDKFGCGKQAKIKRCQWRAYYSPGDSRGGAQKGPDTGKPWIRGNVMALVGVSTDTTFWSNDTAYGEHCLIPNDALSLDTKFDDGSPITGNIQAQSGGPNVQAGPLGYTILRDLKADCVNFSVDPVVYSNENISTTSCNLLFRMQKK